MMQASNHTTYFNRCRNQCLNKVASRTNSLIIYLDKLINDETNKKDFEKKIVSWSEDSDFLKCPACNSKFSLTKRKHHCRLCGKIMCQPCSQYLTITSARKLIGPGTGSYIIGSPCRAGEGSEDRLRVCDGCKSLLNQREKAMDLRTGNSAFVNIYQQLCAHLSQIEILTPSYRRMADSINRGERIYSANAANELEKKLSTIHHKITFLGEQIEQWGISSDSSPKKHNARELVLQRNIKILALNSLHDAIAAMPEISIQFHQVAANMPDETTGDQSDLNVVQQQYLNIKSYLEDAAHSGRLEEVEILEKSLAELESELRNMNLPTPRLMH